MNSARIRTICSWLPTLDEARLREVEDFVLAKAIEQQDAAPADTVVPHDGERTHGGNLSAAGRHGAQRATFRALFNLGAKPRRRSKLPEARVRR